MALTPGTHLGPYVIDDAIGAGGMGEVYRATDSRLGRPVAVKVLTAESLADASRLQRFEHEARAAGALNHPNVLAVYDVGREGGAPYLVTELLEGATLRERLAAGALPVRKSVELAAQIARGLGAAHERGIVHRDLKPENVFVTAEGVAKILDFGLAKLTSRDSGEARPSSGGLTEAGQVLGTVGYMAPEQVRGLPLDHRADVFAFGAILFEMLSGRAAFHAGSPVETLHAVLRDDPVPRLETRADVPSALVRFVRRCLEKQPAERFQSMRDLAFSLEALVVPTGEVAVRPPSGSLPRVAPPPVRFAVPLPPDSRLRELAFSPDGRRLLIWTEDSRGTERLWLRDLGALPLRAVAPGVAATFPCWSPDGRALAFCDVEALKLKVVDVESGAKRVVCALPNPRCRAAWSPEGVLVFTETYDAALVSVPASGGTPVPATELDASLREKSHRDPVFLPDGRRFLFRVRFRRDFAEGTREDAVFVGRLGTKERRLLFETPSRFEFLPPRHLVYRRDKTLVAHPFDADSAEFTGEPVVLAEGVSSGAFTVSATGSLAFQDGDEDRGITELAWFDREGRRLETVGEPFCYGEPNLSPDGRSLAAQVIDVERGQCDIWLFDLERGGRTRLTVGDEGIGPVWSPDGRRIAYASHARNVPTLIVISSDGSGEPHEVVAGCVDVRDWSPDGRFLAYIHREGTERTFVRFVAVDAPAAARQLEIPRSHGARFSPCGRFVAYDATESGRPEVYVRSFPDLTGRQSVSTAGGTEPFWRRDGKEVFYLAPDRTLMAADVAEQGGRLVIGRPRALFTTRARVWNSCYTVSADGQRFLVNVETDPNPTPVTVVLDANALLR